MPDFKSDLNDACDCGRMILTANFSELNTLPDKVSSEVYQKNDAMKIEYFEDLEKNWDADRNLFL